MDAKLEAVLSEYKALREAVLNNFRLQLQIYAVYASGLLVFYSLVFEHKVYNIILIVPLFSLALFMRVIWHESITREVSRYLYKMEEGKITTLVGTVSDEDRSCLNSLNLCIGWQHFWNENKWPDYWVYAARILFVGFSVVPSVLYSIYNLFPRNLQSSGKTVHWYELLFWVFTFVVNTCIGFYIWYRVKNVLPRKKVKVKK